MTNKILSIVSDFKVKAVDDSDTLVIKGFANTTEKDRMGDIVLEEAWTKGGMNNYLKNPIVLAFHDHKNPIGQVVDYGVNAKGLEVTAEISKAAGRTYDLIKEGILRTFSVGFRVKDADYDSGTDVFVIKDLELHEISVVSVPANQNSTFSVAKSFNDEADYKEFLSEFTKEKENMTDKVNNDKVQEPSTVDSDAIAKAVAQALAAEKAKEKAAEEALLAEEKAKEAEKASIITSVKSGAEELLKEVEARFEDKEKSFEEALNGLRTELKEKSEELMAIQNSKMSFADKTSSSRISAEETDNAVLLAKTLGTSIEKTSLGKDLIEKSGGEHLPSGSEADWENTFTTRLYDDIREKLIIEPLFRSIPMSTPTMRLPVNPEAGYGEWIADANLRSSENPADEAPTASSTGVPQTHQLTEATLAAYKLAAKEYIGYEEEEDSIIPILPIIRDAVMRRMAKGSDKALLRGNSTVSAGAGQGTWPFDGLTEIAVDAGIQDNTSVTITGGEKVTATVLQSLRRSMGVWGHDPMDVIYVVSQDAYFDLLEDPDFRTMDVVGNEATIKKGQLGSVNGSPVIVSGEFAAKASGAHAAVAVNASNFLVGNLRGLMVERDRDVVNQKSVIVATRRFGFLDVISGKGASVLTYGA